MPSGQSGSTIAKMSEWVANLTGRRTYHSLRALSLILLLTVVFGAAACASPAASPLAETTPAAMPFSDSSTRLQIDPGQSKASFAIDEILLGEPATVTATSSGVTGEIAVDFAAPGDTAVGPIAIETAQFLTDNEFRNRAIQRRILITSAYPTVTYVPQTISGLPQTIAWGEAVSFKISGDLTITGVTKPVVFEVAVLPISESRLEGQAQATILRQDFGLVVPSATGVAGVAEEILLQLDFVATAGE